MQINVKKLHPDAVIPSYKTAGASGFDLCSVEDCVIAPMQRELVKTGLALSFAPGYELQVRPRSGLALKHGITCLNSPGTVDSDYRGEIMVILINLGSEDFHIKKGERIAQGVLMRVCHASFSQTDALDETARGTGGFGSTGR
ncbi:MAG: dUTP diphosphatase [Helicobacteraceae bacterium]